MNVALCNGEIEGCTVWNVGELDGWCVVDIVDVMIWDAGLLDGDLVDVSVIWYVDNDDVWFIEDDDDIVGWIVDVIGDINAISVGCNVWFDGYIIGFICGISVGFICGVSVGFICSVSVRFICSVSVGFICSVFVGVVVGYFDGDDVGFIVWCLHLYW